MLVIASRLRLGRTNLAMGAIAVHRVDVNVRTVRLRREAIVVNVDPRALDSDSRCVHGVHKVGVLRDDGVVIR